MRAATATLALALCACGTNFQNVCDDIGLCRGQTDDQITLCQTEGKALSDEAKASGCGTAFTAFFGCEHDHYVCNGDTPSFPNCTDQRGQLTLCLDSTRDLNSCGVLATALAGCPGAPPAPAPVPAPCDIDALCTSACWLLQVPNVCAPGTNDLAAFAHCVQQCP
jgi:hypothetical protein